ncbi:MAG TPA: hypothetical protein VM285_03740 [Polyangia bacterium]|nr:hypothetical protein [Polyangia bacterium]HUW16017.1 hypothetical protein [Actinomycetes bacterium]
MNYRYVGDGRCLVGVPARDLDGEDLARLPERLRHRIKSSGLYVPVTKKAAKAAEVAAHV